MLSPRMLFTVCLVGRYHLKDVIVGKIYFLLVRIKIRHMELQIIKRETTGSGMDSAIACRQYWHTNTSTTPCV